MAYQASDVHKKHLQNMCRLCGKRSKEGSRPLQPKGHHAKDIMTVLKVDIGQDTSFVHPPGVCDVCRIQLKRCKDKLRKATKGKTGLQENLGLIDVFDYREHSACCPVCVRVLDLKLLASVGQEAGLATTLASDRLTLTRLSNDGSYVTSYGMISSDGTCKIVVGSRDVSAYHLQGGNAVEKLTHLMIRGNLCQGNRGLDDVLNARRGSDILAVFRDLNNAEVAREEPEGTIRHISCLGFVEEGDNQCTICQKYRSTLRKYRSRIAEDNVKESVSTFTRNDRLSDEDIRKKVAQLQDEKKNLKRKLKSTESKLQAIINEEAVEVPDDLSKDLLSIGSSHSFQEGSLQQLFWQQQEECLKRKKRGNRWHPLIIRFCIGLHAKSPGAYECLRGSVLTLPSARTLRDYTYFVKPTPGLDPYVLKRIADDCNLHSLPDFKKNVALVFDEIHIRQGLVFAAETNELVGWVDVGDINNEILSATRDDKSLPLATHVMCIMIRGIFLSLNQVCAFFPCVGFTADQLFFTIWETVLFVEQVGFRVRALTCDGASSNRKFFRLSLFNSTDANHYAPHPLGPAKEPVYFICDVPHLIKTTRNNWENSGSNSRSKQLMYNGEDISWTQLIQLVQENYPVLRSTSGPVAVLQNIPKLTPQHIYPTPSLRMKVKLATQVLSNRVQLAFSKSPTLHTLTASTRTFIKMFDTFFDSLNVRRKGEEQGTLKLACAPYKEETDWRFEWLENDFLGFLQDWEQQSLARTDLSKKDRMRLCLSKETLEGLRITVRSFVMLAKSLLREDGDKYLLSGKLNQDPLEQHFSKQRNLGGNMENPDVKSFAYNHLRLLVSGSAAVKAVTRGNTSSEEVDTLSKQPMPRRRK